LSYYSAQQYSSHWQVTGGIRNSSYCIITEDQSYYLCKISNEKKEEEVWAQLKALVSLQSYGLLLAYPLKRQINPNNRENGNNMNKKTKNDNRIFIKNYILRLSSIELPIVMYEWKHSRVGNFTALPSISYTTLGTELARIHSVDYNDFLYLPTFSFGMGKMLPLYYEKLHTLPESLQQHSFLVILEKELRLICQTLYKKSPYEVYRDRDYIITNDNYKEKSKNQSKTLPLAILHGDIFLENILFRSNGELDAIVDREDICVGERLIDVTMTLVGCCYDNTDTLSIPRATAFLSAYQDILRLTSCERKYFETFLRYSLLSIACFRWYRFNVEFPSDDRSNSYLPMVKRMNDIHPKIIQHLLLS
jgi:fructosamine-3-kinase